MDQVSRTSARGVYAAGDCTGVLMLASVAAMQGRIAMWHTLGDAVSPLDLKTVSSNVFTAPEIATVGVTQQQVDSGEVAPGRSPSPCAATPVPKCRAMSTASSRCSAAASPALWWAAWWWRHASELIYPLAIAVSERLTVDQVSGSFTVYPSITGSLAEAARRLHGGRTIR